MRKMVAWLAAACGTAAVLLVGAIIALLTRGQMRPARALAMSLVANLASFLLGVPIMSALSLVGIGQ